MSKNIVMAGASSGFGAVTARALGRGAIVTTAALIMANRFVSPIKGVALTDRAVRAWP